MFRKILILVAFTSLCIQACEDGDQQAFRQQQYSKMKPEEITTMRKTIVAWLECEECRERQLDAVLKLGDLAVPTLKAVLEEGPSAASMELLRRQLELAYTEREVYAKTHPEAKPTLSRQAFVSQYLRNFEAMYAARAAQALGRIGGREAQEALEIAASEQHREDVDTAIRSALREIE